MEDLGDHPRFMSAQEAERRRQLNQAAGLGPFGNGITLEWIRSLPGNFRPPWYHPVRRWAWDHNMLSASGDVIFWERFPGERRKEENDEAAP